MILNILRAFFILLMGAVGYYFLTQPEFEILLGNYHWLTIAFSLVVGVLLVCVDILSPRRKLAIFSGTFLGLIVGLCVTYAFSFVVRFVIERYVTIPPQLGPEELAHTREIIEKLVSGIDLLMGVCFCFLAISFVLQTRDDFRFIIPYVEFSKQTRGARPILLDTSVLIDGRISDIAETGILESQLIVPRFVLSELQTVADSADRLTRNRGRRGLDAMHRLQHNARAEVVIYESTHRGEDGPDDVDAKLTELASEIKARILTTDFNLEQVAALRGVDVININDLAKSLKPVVLAGEKMTIRIIKPGESPGQGVGYLEDGTMVVVEHGRPHVNEEAVISVTNVLQTSAGKMIFGKFEAIAEPAPPPPTNERQAS
jgi:uncharacterized protein YacL